MSQMPLISLKSHSGNEPLISGIVASPRISPWLSSWASPLGLQGPLPSVDKEKPHTQTFSHRTLHQGSRQRMDPSLNLLAALRILTAAAGLEM